MAGSLGVVGAAGEAGLGADAGKTAGFRFGLADFFFANGLALGLLPRVAGLAAAFFFEGFSFFVNPVKISRACLARLAARLAALRICFQTFLALLNFCFAPLARFFAASASRAVISAARRAACSSAALAAKASTDFFFGCEGVTVLFFMARELLVNRPPLPAYRSQGSEMASANEFESAAGGAKGKRPNVTFYGRYAAAGSPLLVHEAEAHRQRRGDTGPQEQAQPKESPITLADTPACWRMNQVSSKVVFEFLAN